MVMENIIHLDSVDTYNKLYGLTTLHPLIAVIDLTESDRMVNHVRMTYGLYALFLKQGVHCNIKYGRKNYDYQEGTIVSFAPGQTVEVEMLETEQNARPEVFGILFHPDLIHGTALGRKIHNYSFFDYDQNEALHLSESERAIIMDCFRKIREELQYPVDRHSRMLLTVSVELLLEYCMRFYDRQFITREKINSDLLARFESLLDSYLRGGLAESEGLPSVRFFADRLCLSPGYFGDLVKKETGKTAQEHIQLKIIGMAKERLLGSADGVSQIAYSLGFQYPQHFSRLFKKATGLTPNEYRRSRDN